MKKKLIYNILLFELFLIKTSLIKTLDTFVRRHPTIQKTLAYLALKTVFKSWCVPCKDRVQEEMKSQAFGLVCRGGQCANL